MVKEVFEIVESASKKMMLDQFELIKQLNPDLEYSGYEKMIEDMVLLNYQMLCIFINQKCIAVSGYWLATKIYCGKYLEADNVVVDAAHRSEGIGKLMCDALEKIAMANNCKVMMLDAYLSNEAAHHFYEREGYAKKGYHFVKTL